MEIKTFKQVHEDLEKESIFLAKSRNRHDITNFAEKANALKGMGFVNSIATKMYSGIVGSQETAKNYEREYCGKYKFIIKPQLERICEKYNLFVRDTEFFIGDIPESNVKELINSWVYFKHLELYINCINQPALGRIIDNWLLENRIYDSCNTYDHIFISYKIPIQALGSIPSSNYKPLKIAAVESLFDQKAFSKSRSRIIDTIDPPAKGQVDLDPIVLLEVIGGYLIITAWGDEANDEIVLNPIKN